MAVERSLKARPIAIRNECLSRLAMEHGLPIPSDADAALLGPGLGLDEAWTRWRAAHGAAATAVLPAPAGPLRRVRRWRSARVEAPILGALSAVLVALVVRPHPSPAELENPDPVAAVGTAVAWTGVTDSVRLELSARLQAVERSRLPLSTSLSAAELTALLFSRSQPRQLVRLDGLESRIDSLWWVRGRLRDGARFEIGGRVYLAQRRRAELRVSRLVVDGAVIPVGMSDLVLARIQGRPATPRSGRVWFEVPDFVANVRIGQGRAPFSTRGLARP